MNLSGKVALVTGGTNGIGAATALALARAGSAVAINGRHSDADALETLAQLQRMGGRVELILGDCARPGDCAAMVAETVSKLGRLDVLIHSAGGPANGGLFDITPENWHTAFDTHLHAVFHLTRAALPHMRPHREGAVILVSSTAGIRGIVTNVAYQVVKGALPQFARALAREFADDNIRVNCVAPGVIRTAFHKSMSEEQRRLNLEKRIPLHREGTPENVASVILELVTNDYVTGETFTIDGGLTMRIA